MTIRDTAWGAFLMGSEGWAVFAGHKMVVSHLAEDQAHSIVAEVAQLEERVRELEDDNKLVAQLAAKAAAKNVQIDGLLGYACVLESMLRKQGAKLPPRPSLMNEIHRHDEDTGNSEKALGES